MEEIVLFLNSCGINLKAELKDKIIKKFEGIKMTIASGKSK